MLRRDFIMAQIEELAKVIVQLIGLRSTDNPARQNNMIAEIYSSLKTDRNYLLQADPEAIYAAMDEGGHSGILRMEIAAKAMIEDSFVCADEKKHLLLKSKQMLEYIQQHDHTFSIERIDLLNEIERLLA